MYDVKFLFDEIMKFIVLFFYREEIKTRYEGKISKELSGPTYEVLGKIMKVLVNRKITTPGSFVGLVFCSCILCSYFSKIKTIRLP